MRLTRTALRDEGSGRISLWPAGRGPAARGSDAVRPVLREEPDPLRQVRLAHLHDRPLRDLLLPGDRAASRAGRGLRGERVPADQRRPEARPARSRSRSSCSRRTASSSRRTSSPGAAQEGVGAFAEPTRQRMVLPIDEPPDQLYGLIVHELTHIFEFDIIPQGADPPERAAVGERRRCRTTSAGHWTPIDLMTVRDAAVADIVPKMSETRRLRQHQQPAPGPTTSGHAVLRVHRGEVGQGRHPAVPVLAAQERHRRRRGRLRRSVQDEEGRVRPGVRALPEGALQAVPRQGAAGRLRPRTWRRTRKRRVRRARSRSRRRRPAT